jgi:hypothetical protein
MKLSKILTHRCIYNNAARLSHATVKVTHALHPQINKKKESKKKNTEIKC